MGSPELPGDSCEEDLNKFENNLANIRGPIPSDDSDNDESDHTYDGYQPLSIADQGDDIVDLDNQLLEDTQDTSNAHNNLPIIESIDAEVERQVWNEPRPRELQIELDSSRTQQIMSAMANVTLPNVAIPEWAVGVSEERWKEELLERIRQRNGNTKAQKENDLSS